MGDQVETKRSFCMWCHSHCRVSVQIEGGRLTGVEEYKEDPFHKLYGPVTKSCLRARAAAEYFYHPDRLTFPLKRMGAKGEGKWQEIGWDQALDEIAEGIDGIRQEYGPEAIATSSGTGRTHDEYRTRFFNLLGSPNHVGQGHICYGPQLVQNNAMFGWFLFPVITTETRCVLAWGGGVPMLYPPLWRATLEALDRKTKLIVVDPRRIASASRADVWLQPRPGTDTALALSMINVIIEEGLYHRQFVEKWCHGFDRLAERAGEYPPERAAGITWVPAEKIRDAARMYATNSPAASTHGMGIEHLANSIEALHARYALPAITGNIDVRGGDLMTGPHPKIITGPELDLAEEMPPEQRAKQIGADRFKLASWPGYEIMAPEMKRVWGKVCGGSTYGAFANAPMVYRAMLTGKPYPVRAMITASSNPMITQGDTKLVHKALKSLDLYVVADYFMTPSAELADYVLPGAMWLERPYIYDGYGVTKSIFVCEAAMPAAVPGQYDRRTDYDIYRGLGIRLGQKEYWPWETLEAAYDYRLAPLGCNLAEFVSQKGGWDSPTTEFRKWEKSGFGTPTGKIELYSTVFEKLGYDPLPRFEEPPEGPVSSPDLAGKYPLILITGGRFNPMYHSEHRQIDSLRRRTPEPIMQLNPGKAAELGIKDGDWAWIETPRGRIRQKCQLFEGIAPGVVHVQHGWWFPELPGEEPWLHGVWESNANVLTDDEPDHCNKLNGGWPLRSLLCRVYKAKDYRRESAKVD